jgi:hypothetical protein
MRSRRVLTGALGFVLALTACASPAPAVVETGAPTAVTVPTDVSTPPVRPESAEPLRLVISLDAVTGEFADHAEAIDYANAAGVVALLTSIAGPPKVTEIPQKGFTTYEWAGVLVSADGSGRFLLQVSATSIGAVRIETVEGIAVGSSRDTAVAAGAADGYDSDGDGRADYLELGAREVPGTTSLTDPNVTGHQYLQLVLNGDVVATLRAPNNDYNDL